MLAPITIRPVEIRDVPEIAGIHVDAWDRAFRGILPDDEIEKRNLERRLQQWSKMLENHARIVLVACDNRGVVRGFCSAIPTPGEEYESYLETLYVAPDAWGRGTGRALLGAMSNRLLETGVRNVALRTLRLAASRGFYERLGARLVPEGVVRDAHHFDDAVYAFDDLRTLAETSA